MKRSYTYLISLLFIVLYSLTSAAEQVDLKENSILVGKLISNEDYVEAEKIARFSIELTPRDTYFLRALDISLIGQSRYEEAEVVRDRIIEVWAKYEKPKWIAAGSPVGQSAWLRSTKLTNSYEVIGTEYFQPEVKREKSLTTAFYKIIGYPTETEHSPRLFKLERSGLDDSMYSLREKSDRNNRLVVNYGDVKPAFHTVVSDTITFLESTKSVSIETKELRNLSEQIKPLLLASMFSEAEPLIRKGVKQAPDNLFFTSALDITLNGLGRYKEAEVMRSQIKSNWEQNVKTDWIASGSPSKESKWLRTLLPAQSYSVWGSEYFQPSIKGTKFPITTFYLINAQPKGPGFRHRYFNLEMSKLDQEFYVLREASNNGGRQLTQYGVNKPQIHTVMSDVIDFLNAGY